MLFTVALGVLGVVALYLLYALVARVFWPAPDPTRPEDAAPLAGGFIQVEVRNGSGAEGLAQAMTEYLRGRGFDVVEMGNYGSFDVAETVVIDRVGNAEVARRVAEALGLPEERVREEIRQDYFLDASVVIGKDYATLPPFRDD